VAAVVAVAAVLDLSPFFFFRAGEGLERERERASILSTGGGAERLKEESAVQTAEVSSGVVGVDCRGVLESARDSRSTRGGEAAAAAASGSCSGGEHTRGVGAVSDWKRSSTTSSSNEPRGPKSSKGMRGGAHWRRGILCE
jgi:hypothetical protein